MRRFFALLVLGAGPWTAQAQEDVAAGAQAVLQKHCVRCHGDAESEYFSARDPKTLLVKGIGNDKAYVTAGKLEGSLLWDYVKDNNAAMPRKKSPERESFGDEQRATIKAWILAGAPAFPQEAARTPIALETMLKAIRDHAADAPAEDVPYLRYFTVTHLHNNNQQVRAADLQLARAALAKAINSLSWSQKLVRPEAVPGTQDTVFAVHIGKLGWSRAHWNAIKEAYPYDLGYANHENGRLRDIDDRLRKLYTGAELIHLRADWFVATATRPPLYHQLLFDLSIKELHKRADDPKQPANPKRMTTQDLEHYLGLGDVRNKLFAAHPEAIRAGFPNSGVSNNNRLIERHPLLGQGYYWKSYDFKSSTWEANLQQFPLGPRFEGNPFEHVAFRHDGGEMIFTLPNGLQGYFLADGKDNRIDAGPIEVVSDGSRTAGTPVVVNGLSCIACHKVGMKPAPPDQVRAAKAVFGEARARVELLYPEKKTFDAVLAKDQKRFLEALEETVGPFLRVSKEHQKTPLGEFPEAVEEVAKRYILQDLDAGTVACELYLGNVKELADRARDPGGVLRQLGLGALAEPEGKIKRGAWESVRGTSQMQQAARVFGYSPR